MRAKSFQLCSTLYNPMDCRLPSSSVHGILQERKNTGVGCHALLKASSQTRDRTCVSYVSCIGRWVLYHWVTLKQAYYVSLFLRSAQNSSFNSVPVSTVKWIKMEYGCQCACVCLCVHTYMFMCLK